MAFYLLQGIQYHPYQNQQRSTSVEMGKLIIHPKEARDGREYGHNGQKYRTRKRDFGNHAIYVIIGRLPRFDTGDEPSVLLHIFRHLLWVDHNRRIEESEGNEIGRASCRERE